MKKETDGNERSKDWSGKVEKMGGERWTKRERELEETGGGR